MVKKHIFLFFFLGIFLISFTSALEFDNIGSYDTTTNTITITNAFGLGDAIGGAQRNTPQINKVAPGYQKTAEFDLWAYEDYNDVIKNLKVYDRNYHDWENHELTKDIDIKIKSYENISVNNYESILTGYTDNGTAIYEQQLVGSHLEEREVWTKLTPADLKKNDRVTIGIFTDVEIGDRVEWILELYGVAVNEWAVWTADLNVGLVSYYKFDNNNLSDELGNHALTNSGTANATGKIIDGRDFVNPDEIFVDTDFSFAGDFTWAGWIDIDVNGNHLFSDINEATGNEGRTRFDATGILMGTQSEANVLINDGTILNTGAGYQLLVIKRESNIMFVYINNVNTSNSVSRTGTLIINTLGGKPGAATGVPEFDGRMDEVGIWNRSLSTAEITQLYNGGAGISYTDDFTGITVTQNTPLNNSIINDNLVNFNFTITPKGINITNWTLTSWYTNGTLEHQHINTTINENETISIIHNDTLFFDETYVWNVESCGTDGLEIVCDTSENWTFTIDTLPPVVNITYPTEGFIVDNPGQNITLNYTITHDTAVTNCFWNSTYNSTPINISCTLNTTTFLYPPTNPNNLTIYVWGNDSVNLGVDNVTIFKDTISPQINITAPPGLLNYNYIGGNETLNLTVTDTNLDSCWYNYNGTNITIDGCLTGVKNSTIFILEQGRFNMTVYANDTLGNLNATFIEWSYTIVEINQTFEENITEGELDDFSLLLNISDASSLTDATFSYNGTNYTTTIVFSSGLYLISSLIVSPTVDTDTNFSFNFFFTVDDINYSTLVNEQLVVNSLFSICGGLSNDTLLNMSLLDEETGTNISGTMEIIADIVSKSSGVTVGTVNNTFENVEYGAICFTPVSLYPSYYLNAEIKYSSDGYVSELYYIQNSDMVDYPKNLTLFDLNQTDSTEFVVTFQNDAFIFVEGAIIQLQRKYIGENVFKTVEAPITADGGKAIVHIDLNTNIYRASVVKDGELLKFFDEIVFSCENELAGECTQQLRGDVDPNNNVPIETLTDFSYSVSVSDENNTVNVLFTVPSGAPSSINVLLEQIDMFGNSTACNNTVITSAGSITCDFSDTIEKSILQLTISKDGTQLAITNYGVDPELDMDGINFFIVFLFLISLVGMAIASPEWMMIIGVMVFMISGTLLLLKGMSLAMGLGAMAWLVVAVIIIILKMAKQEDR